MSIISHILIQFKNSDLNFHPEIYEIQKGIKKQYQAMTVHSLKENKNLLIAGGTGLIGRELGQILAKKGYNLFVLTRKPDQSLLNTPYPHQPLSWKDLSSPIGQNIFQKIDGIINLTGASIAGKRWTKAYKKKLWRSRVNTSEQLVFLCNQYPQRIRCFLSASATGYYGDKVKTTYEGDPAGSGFLPSLCQQWEQTIQKLTIRWVIFRIGLVFSVKGGFLSYITPFIQKGLGGPLSDGKQIVSWIDIEDLTQMFVFALENNLSGVFNCVAPHTATNKEIVKAIAKRFQTKTFFSIPALFPRLMLGEMSQLVLNNQNISCNKIEQTGFQFQTPHWNNFLEKHIQKLKKTEKRLIFEQWVPYERKNVFSFLSLSNNLRKITPPFLKLQMRSVSDKKLKQGSVIKYKFKFYGIPIRWTAFITSWNSFKEFTDIQKKGPFKMWIHQHSFENLGKGTLITDTVNYIPPFGILGDLLIGWQIQRNIRRIFKYRKKALLKALKKSSYF